MPKKVRLAEPPVRYELRVTDVSPVGDDVFVLRLAGRYPAWKAGDGLAVFSRDATGLSRPYSLSGAEGAEEIELWVRRFPGGAMSEALTRSRPGDRWEVSAPFGWFRPGEPAEARKYYFATGTGIAPYLSALRSGYAPPERLFWGMRRELCLPEDVPPERIERWVSRETVPGAKRGRVTDVLAELNPAPSDHIYACGLDKMIEEVLGCFTENGVPREQLHRECFFTG